MKKNKNIYISSDGFNNLLKIKESINSYRTNFDGYIISYLMITKYWLLAFVEGDGSFYISNNRAIFFITQKDRKVLEAISIFCKNIKRAQIIMIYIKHQNLYVKYQVKTIILLIS